VEGRPHLEQPYAAGSKWQVTLTTGIACPDRMEGPLSIEHSTDCSCVHRMVMMPGALILRGRTSEEVHLTITRRR
jgi:hypothetical protein